MELCLAVIHTRNTKGADASKPMAQMLASIRLYFGRSFWAIKLPRGTPIRPDIIEMMPNLYGTLKKIVRICNNKK